MCWFIVDPETGEHEQHIETANQVQEGKVYAPNGFFDGFFDAAWAFEWFLASHPRPPFEDLVAFVVDGHIPASLHDRIGPELDRHHRAIRDYWEYLDSSPDGYREFIGRPMRREEKYWLVEHWLRRLAVGSEQFYAGKAVEREEWLVNWRAREKDDWRGDCWGRLRIFSDGTADAWCPGLGLMGYDTEEDARRELGASGHSTWEELNEGLFHGRVPPPSDSLREQTRQQLNAMSEPFRYRKEY
ncbi:MAG: hypothetical protein J0I06_20800 [Planctomycetes bacterium]|nr:hypothetical protein [Planctomycetota bacterium]